ncbi:uncharacterized protein TRUGW13939_07138 [Talaromyces rugulosus]|uniref:Glutamate decarboxylase n=1 Tax=Talaromyces rugulosus TaxID=121627 RepID=A0A7H8R1R4_TALRU|nr:uncharacterized protein TRUGW13939_07138 [Talaromyces rugulosus]QKX59996.1 hypothetical protein TRUGW13939_07138 [Talaromyces rugulosus]
MVLSLSIDPDELIKTLRTTPDKNVKANIYTENAVASTTPYSTRYSSKESIPKYRLPQNGAPGDVAAQLLRDELDLDGRPNLNLASFVGTYMERQANVLMAENIAKNLADADEYPALMAMHSRCISILANMWGAQPNEKAIGSATVGSSEAIMLGGKAMQRRWQEKRRAAGKDTQRPNILMGANAQVALEKFACYFDVEARILDVSEKSNFALDPDMVRKNIDENTIGVFVILGSTYTGHFEPVEEVSKVLDKYEEETGHDIPIHIDGASGGFIAPFTYAGAGQKWNFELPRVKSINTSGHKFGLVYAGLGWVLWRDESYLPKDLIFQLHYLGGTEESYTLNFSRPGAPVIGQYYNFIHLGFNGYRDIMENCLANARLLSKALERTGWFKCVSSIHQPIKKSKTAKDVVLGSSSGETSADYAAGLPVVAFHFSDEFQKDYSHVKQESVSILLRAKQYIIPNYPLPPTANEIEILRVVIRESMSADLLERLISDIVAVTERLVKSDPVDLSNLQTEAHHTRIERHQRKSKAHEQQNSGKNWMKSMGQGVHKSVC